MGRAQRTATSDHRNGVSAKRRQASRSVHLGKAVRVPKRWSGLESVLRFVEFRHTIGPPRGRSVDDHARHSTGAGKTTPSESTQADAKPAAARPGSRGLVAHRSSSARPVGMPVMRSVFVGGVGQCFGDRARNSSRTEDRAAAGLGRRSTVALADRPQSNRRPRLLPDRVVRQEVERVGVGPRHAAARLSDRVAVPEPEVASLQL